MLRMRFFSRLRRWLTILAVAATLAPVAAAKPKFKVLANVPGGLWDGVSLDSKGNLWGVSRGGAFGYGSVFELIPRPGGNWKLITIHSFYSGEEGDSPIGRLIFDPVGNVYGTTLNSPAGGGTVYELSRGTAGWSVAVLHDFEIDGVDGDHPSGLVMDAAGNLYGVGGAGSNGAGVVFELSPGSGGWTEQVLYNFGNYPYDAEFPSGIALGGAGDVYGAATTGGKYSWYGAIFELEKSNSWAESLLWQFDGTDGGGAQHGVAFGRPGSLYGTSGGGPANNECYGYPCGIAFKLTWLRRGQWKEAVLYDFSDPLEGFSPSSGLVRAKTGALYGTTGVGGIGNCPDGCGVVYQLSPGAKGKWKYNALHRFDVSDGSMPGGNLAIDDKGNVYGTAYDVVFEVTP